MVPIQSGGDRHIELVSVCCFAFLSEFEMWISSLPEFFSFELLNFYYSCFVSYYTPIQRLYFDFKI